MPGHGGVDPGAIGVSGVYEKNITLAMARELKEHLEDKYGYKVYMTRNRDIFIPLRDRVKIARRYEADLFLSIHADSAANKRASGLSVYTLSEKASDKEAAALAEKENKADIVAGLNFAEHSKEVSDILLNLAQRETLNRSSEFATFMVKEMRKSDPYFGQYSPLCRICRFEGAGHSFRFDGVGVSLQPYRGKTAATEIIS